jgi:hypothetical protein
MFLGDDLMKSPFPGMDPYLEQFWREIHAGLIIYARDQLQDKLPPGLRCRVEERVFLSFEGETGRSMYPDVRIMERPQTHNGGSTLTEVALAEPLIFHLDEEPLTETFLEIVDVSSGHKVITVLEILSSSNKFPGPGQEKYQQEQQELKDAKVSLVEIDLLRSGQRIQVVPEYRISPRNRTPYRVCVRRGWEPTKAEFYPLPLQKPLPIIKVPLRQSDPDAALELQPLVEKCYQQGRFDEDIDYRKEPDPPLTADEAAWADNVLRQAGKR